MDERLEIDLYVEDRAQEVFVSALVRRLADEAKTRIQLRVRWARGGAPRMLGELKRFQKIVEKHALDKPHLLIVARDANCKSWNEVYQKVNKYIDKRIFPVFALACPVPHIERWFLADPASFQQVAGAECQPGKRKCERGLYKKILKETLLEGGNPVRLGGIEYAEDIVNAIDLHQARDNEPSLDHFIDELQKALTSLTSHSK